MTDETLRLELELWALRRQVRDVEQRLARAREVPVREQDLERPRIYYATDIVWYPDIVRRPRWIRAEPKRMRRRWKGNRTGLTTKHRNLGVGVVSAPSRGCRVWPEEGLAATTLSLPTAAYRSALRVRDQAGRPRRGK